MRVSLLFVLLIVCWPAFSQYEKQEQITTFSSRLRSPVEVEVVKNNNSSEFVFYANNKSYFPYQFELSFDQFVNLQPIIGKHNQILHPGRNRLFSVKIRDENTGPGYSYQISYRMGAPSRKMEPEYPYLIPIAPGKKVEFHNIRTEEGTFYSTGTFKIVSGDTIFAIRKGIVTALPNDDAERDRVSRGTLEILHEDGSIALYSQLTLTTLLVDYGDKIFPGQPVAISAEAEVFSVNVYAFSENGTISGINPVFASGSQIDLTMRQLNGITVSHPAEVIERELSAREKKKMKRK